MFRVIEGALTDFIDLKEVEAIAQTQERLLDLIINEIQYLSQSENWDQTENVDEDVFDYLCCYYFIGVQFLKNVMVQQMMEASRQMNY